jgi:hypothetical protein
VLGDVVLRVGLRLTACLEGLAGVRHEALGARLPGLLFDGELVRRGERDLLRAELFLHIVGREAVLGGHRESKDRQKGGNHETTAREDEVEGSALHFFSP